MTCTVKQSKAVWLGYYTIYAPKVKGKGIRFIVLYPPKRSHNSLAGLYTRKPFQSPREIPEQLAAYSEHALSTALLMLGTHFAVG